MVTTVLSTCEDADKYWSPSLQGDAEMQSQLSLLLTSGSTREMFGNALKTKALNIQP